jgi:hypothetical protein
MIRVECTASGTNGLADPTVLWFGARRVEVRAVTDRWYGSEQRWWKVETVDGSYIVRLGESPERGSLPPSCVGSASETCWGLPAPSYCVPAA